MKLNQRAELILSRRAALIATGTLLASGCFGSFGATNALYDWNKDVSSNKWLRWLVFLVLVIVPVYSLFIVADALVLNTIEFFSGKNPIGHSDLGNGRALRTEGTQDPNLVKHEVVEAGKVVRTFYVRRVHAHELLLLDERLRAVGRARVLDDGRVEVLDGRDHSVSTFAPEQVERVEAALAAGASPSRAVATALDLPARQVLLALGR